jgi:hypothetical protein
MELEDAGQTTIGIIRDRCDFDSASLTLPRTISSRFASIEPGKNKRSIGAINSNANKGADQGKGRGRHGSRGINNLGGRMRVQINGVDVTDVTRNFTSDEWDKLRAVGGHTYVYQRRDFISGNNYGRGAITVEVAAVMVVAVVLHVLVAATKKVAELTTPVSMLRSTTLLRPTPPPTLLSMILQIHPSPRHSPPRRRMRGVGVLAEVSDRDAPIG